MKMHISMIPQEIIDKYNLEHFKDDKGWFYMIIDKGVYILKQAGIISNNDRQKHLKPYGYAPVRNPPGLWEFKGRHTMFTLVVDDFWSRLLQNNVHSTSIMHWRKNTKLP